MKQFLFLLVLCLPLLVVSALAAAGTEESEAEVLDLSSFELEPYGYTYGDDGTFYVLYEMDDGQVWAITRSAEEDDSLVAYSWSEDDGIMPLAVMTATAAGGKFTFTYETAQYVAIRGIKATYGSYEFALTEMLYNTFNYYDSALASVVTDTNFQLLLDLFKRVFPESYYWYYAGVGDLSSSTASLTDSPIFAMQHDLFNLAYTLTAWSGGSYLTYDGNVGQVGVIPSGARLFNLLAESFLGLHGDINALISSFPSITRYLNESGDVIGLSLEDALPFAQANITGIMGLGSLITDLNTYFSNVMGTTGYTGSIPFLSSPDSTPVSSSLSKATLPQLLVAMDSNLSNRLASTVYLDTNGYAKSGTYGIGYVLGQGLLGIRSLVAGSSIDNQYIFTAFSNSFESDDSVDIESEDITYTGLGPLLNGALSHLSWQVGLLNTVFASDTDLEMRQDAEENMNAASDAVLKPGSPGSVSGSDIGNMGDISGSTGALTNTGVGGVSAISAIDAYGSDIWAFFTQETANALDSTVSTASDDEYYTDAFGANMAQFYAAMGFGDYEHSTVVEDEVAAFWADYYGGAE